MLKNAQKDFIQRHIGPTEEEQNIRQLANSMKTDHGRSSRF